jgi:hypothetical protein
MWAGRRHTRRDDIPSERSPAGPRRSRSGAARSGGETRQRQVPVWCGAHGRSECPAGRARSVDAMLSASIILVASHETDSDSRTGGGSVTVISGNTCTHSALPCPCWLPCGDNCGVPWTGCQRGTRSEANAACAGASVLSGLHCDAHMKAGPYRADVARSLAQVPLSRADVARSLAGVPLSRADFALSLAHGSVQRLRPLVGRLAACGPTHACALAHSRTRAHTRARTGAAGSCIEVEMVHPVDPGVGRRANMKRACK